MASDNWQYEEMLDAVFYRSVEFLHIFVLSKSCASKIALLQAAETS
jgi:hypothetical protein